MKGAGAGQERGKQAAGAKGMFVAATLQERGNRAQTQTSDAGVTHLPKCELEREGEEGGRDRALSTEPDMLLLYLKCEHGRGRRR